LFRAVLAVHVADAVGRLARVGVDPAAVPAHEPQ
jgi:hypothetical protein